MLCVITCACGAKVRSSGSKIVLAHGRRRLLSSRDLVLIESVSLKPSSKGGDADRVTCGSDTVPVSGDDSYQTASSNN